MDKLNNQPLDLLTLIFIMTNLAMLSDYFTSTFLMGVLASTTLWVGLLGWLVLYKFPTSVRLAVLRDRKAQRREVISMSVPTPSLITRA